MCSLAGVRVLFQSLVSMGTWFVLMFRRQSGTAVTEAVGQLNGGKWCMRCRQALMSCSACPVFKVFRIARWQRALL